jgi:hypothetical protein
MAYVIGGALVLVAGFCLVLRRALRGVSETLDKIT